MIIGSTYYYSYCFPFEVMAMINRPSYALTLLQGIFSSLTFQLCSVISISQFASQFVWALGPTFFFFLPFLGLHLHHMEVPRLGFESELQLPAYATATATRDPSHICDLCHSLQQHQNPNPFNEARD